MMSKRISSVLGIVACAAFLALPLVAGQNAAPATGHSSRSALPAETLSGTITMVDSALHLVVVKDASGVPFDIMVTHNTRIMSGGQRLNLSALNSDINREVTLRFVPEGRGDIARSVQVKG
jgi:hypothetical protein